MEEKTLEKAIFLESARLYPDHKDNTEERWLDIGKYRQGFKLGAEFGAEWQAERMPSEIEQKWLEYRNITNNEDAWCFKEWLVNEF